MAVIDSKKLLPPSKKGGSIEKQKFLVPIKNISTKKIKGSDLKPVDKEKESSGSLVVVRKKIIKLGNLINNSLLIDQKERSSKRKEDEKSKAEKREKDIEKKVKRNDIKFNLIPSIPGGSIFDVINRFIGFTLLGYLFNKYAEYLPKLLELGKKLEPAVKFIEDFSKNILKGVVGFIEFGYKTYDSIHDSIKKIGGDGAAKTFDEFSKNLNLVLTGAVAAAALTLSTSPNKGKVGPQATVAEAPKVTTSGGRELSKPGIRNPLRQRPKISIAGGSKGIGRFAGKAFGRIPIIGGLVNFLFALWSGEKPGRAAAKAVGSTIGAALGTFVPVPFVGTILGGILGDIVGGALYDTVAGQPKPQAKAQGGVVSRGGRSQVAPKRKIKTTRTKQVKRISPQKTQPGKDVGGKLKIEQLYGTDEPGKRSALRALKKSSEDVKKMKSLGGLPAAMFGAGIDMSLGQRPDRNLANSLGGIFGSVIQSAVDAELNSSFGDISKSLGMANGGVVPSREIGNKLSIGERVGKFISKALAISIESSAARILQNLNREMQLEGTPAGGGGGDDGGPGAGPMVSSDSADFWLLSLISLYENANPQGASDVAQSIYNRMGYSGRTARQLILARNQYEPVGKFGSVSEWNKVVDKESALNHIKKYPGNSASASGLEKVAATLLDKSAQQNSAKWVSNRPDFRSESYEKSNDDMTDDISRYGQTFGFNKGSAYKGKSPVAQRIPSLVKGTVSQPVAKGNILSESQTVVVEGNFRLRQDAAQAYLAMKDAAKKDGINLTLISAWRDSAKQKMLYQAYLEGRGNLAAPPGSSNHERGIAIDLRNGIPWAQKNCNRFGWSNTGMTFSQKEPWHFDYVGGYSPRSTSPTSSTNRGSGRPSLDLPGLGLKRNPRTGIWEKASLAPTQSSAVASLNRNGILNKSTDIILREQDIFFQEVQTTSLA